jgi:uncharacterized protein (DUF362 family)/Pyruvate/2-oxoacid:ferredoxin oxidoreductase delta subunit
MDMDTVIFHPAEYEYGTLKTTISGLLAGLGSLRIEPGARVLIKPNFLAPAKPERAMTTHPLVVRAVVEYVLQQGALPLVADSPGMGTFERLLREGGYGEALKGLDVELRPFRESLPVDIGEPFGKIAIAREALEADAVINLPKLKAHAMMLLTLGVKNLFGCVVGLAKVQWHMRSGVNRYLFARLLVQIYRAVNPAATLIDGILGMEGQGPGRSGTPRRLGVLVAGASAPAVDLAVCRLLRVSADELPTHRAAAELNLVPRDVAISGDFQPVKAFSLPVLGPLTFGPRRFEPLIRQHLIQRPSVEAGKCRMCGECWRHCPAHAIMPHASVVEFDYDRCIRCYCCVEMCPHGALAAVETGPAKALRCLSALRDRVVQRVGRSRADRRNSRRIDFEE